MKKPLVLMLVSILAGCGGGGGNGSSITPPVSVNVLVSPAAAAIPTGKTQQFTASVTGTSDTAVTWQVNGMTGGDSNVGTISSMGLYTAPKTAPTPATVTIAAVLQADPTKSGSASVSVISVSVTVSPSSANVQVASRQQFTAMVSGTSNVALSWMVNGSTSGNSTVGTISSSGLYTAPINVPNPPMVIISAVSFADPTKSGTASVRVILPPMGHVFLIVEENHSYSSVIGNPVMPFLNTLANQHSLATNYFANFHPSIGNYFMLTTGQMVTGDDNFSSTVDVDNIVRELLAAGKTWKSYAEDLPSVGYTGGDVFPYLEHHNPFSYFSDVRNSSVQKNNLVPFTQFTAHLANNQLPTFAFILPNAEHDAHSCPASNPSCTDTDMLTAADTWLKTNIQSLLSSTTFQQDGLLVIVFDESNTADVQNGGGHVAMIIVSPKAKSGFQSTKLYQHQSTLRLLIEATGAAALPGASAGASDMGEFFP